MVVEGFSLLIDLGMILLAATLFNYIARLLKQPALLAYIVAGLVIGPLGLGALGLEFAGIPIGVTTTEEIMLLSELGVAFLLFSIGIESNFQKIAEMGKLVVIGSVVQVTLTAAAVFVFKYFIGLLTFEQSLYLGMIIAFSSTTIVVKLLSDERQINTLHGRIMIGFLLMQDVLIILALPILDNLSNAISIELVAGLVFQVGILLVFAYVMNRYAYPRLFSFASHSDELFFLSALSSVFIFIFLSYILGFSIAVGAFIAGVALSTLPYNLEVLNKIRGVRDFLATIFFVTLGIQITPGFASFPLLLGLFLVFAVFLLKPLLFYIITLLNGYGGRVSLMVGLGLAQVSEFSFIIANQGKAILNQTPGLYSFLIVLIAGSMAATPYFMGYSNFFHDLVEKVFGRFLKPVHESLKLNRRINELESISDNLHNHIVIFGGGLVGSGIASALKGNNEVVVVDSDSEAVLSNIAMGTSAIYGSADNPEIWHKVNVEDAKVVVIAIPVAKQGVDVLKFLKKRNPKSVVFARARYFRDALTFYELGADFVVMPQVIGSNVFVEKVAQYLNTGNIESISNFKQEFMIYLKDKAKTERVYYY